MKNITKDLLPTITSCILRQPTQHFYWNFWTFLSDPNSAIEINNLLETIVVSPLGNTLDIPPYDTKRFLTDKYKQAENWLGIQYLLEYRWDTLKNTTEINNIILTSALWVEDTLPLLEAYLNLNNNEKLKELLGIWKISPRWENNFKQQVTRLFEQYDRIYKD